MNKTIFVSPCCDSEVLIKGDHAFCKACGAYGPIKMLKVEHDEHCERELTSHGYTPCRCEDRRNP